MYLQSRIRSPYEFIPMRLRFATNPGGISHEFFKKRFAPWLNPENTIKAESGEVLWFLNVNGEEKIVPEKTPGALSRTFIKARLTDNPFLTKTSQYRQALEQLPAIERRRLLDGDWGVIDGKRLLFKREWIKTVKNLPQSDVLYNARGQRIKGDKWVFARYWDRAATEDTGDVGRDPDWTVGLKMLMIERKTGEAKHREFYIVDIDRFRGTPYQVQQRIRRIGIADGLGTYVVLEEDPGAAGKAEMYQYKNVLQGLNMKIMKKRNANKAVFAGPVSSASEHGMISILVDSDESARKAVTFFDELEAFDPDEWTHNHDDQVDALSGAFMFLQGFNEFEAVKTYKGCM